MDPVPQSTSTRDVDISALPSGAKIGRYEVISVLGHGGFGITYRARDAQLDREVAIKEYLPTSLAYREAGATVLPRSTKVADDFNSGRQQFVAEGRTLATLHEAPGIVKVFDFLETNGTAYIVMELLRGDTLEVYLRQNGPMDAEAVRRILWPLLGGLEQVHAIGFLHRDIKPPNILLNNSGQPTLIDFGAARASMAGRTGAMTAIFTPGYAAAEQFSSARQGPWTDIYGLSATLYHAITGAMPPSAVDRMLDDNYVPLVVRAPAGFPSNLLAGIDAGLAVRSSERPQSIAGWRSILRMATAPGDGATFVIPRPRDARPATAKSEMPQSARSDVLSSTTPSAATAVPNRLLFYAGVAVALVSLVVGGYFALAPSRAINLGAAIQSLTADELSKALDERRKADAAEKRRLGDGLWRGTYRCTPSSAGGPAFDITVQLTVSGGSGTWKRSSPGSPGYTAITVKILGNAVNVFRDFSPFDRPRETKGVTMRARYDGSHSITGSGPEDIGRTCDIDLTRE